MQHIIHPTDVRRFLEDLRQRERSAATIEKYARALRDFTAQLPDGAVDKDAVLDYKAALAARLSPAGANAYLAALNGFFAFMGWPECRVRLLRLQRRVFESRERELTRPEYQRLVAAAEHLGSETDALLLQLLASTGIRASETAAITLEAAQTGKAVISLKGKIRVILLPERLCRKLLRYAKRRGVTAGPLFRSRTGRPLDRKALWARLKRLSRAAGVAPEKVFPHNLRHLFAREFYRAQRDLSRLADLLGHSSVETTRIYLRTSGQEHRRALEQLHLVC